MRRVVLVLSIGLAVGVGIAACNNGGVTFATPPGSLDGSIQIDSGVPAGLGMNQPCDATNTCRPGLACTSGMCALGHSLGDGTPCVLNGECKTGDYCGPARTCVASSGTGQDGAACQGDGDCVGGLRCTIVGLSAQCKPEGTGDVGGTCAASGDCLGGLTCLAKTCTPLPPSPSGIPILGIPGFAGVDCQDNPAPVKAYFRVPRGTDDGDFFRLPFPNDIRKNGSHLDLTGFPTPGTDLLGFDIVDRYARDLEAHADEFSAYTTVTFRFSGSVDFDSLKDNGVIRWVDITPGGDGNDLGFAWNATTGRNKYVCPNALSARPPQGAPLAPGSTQVVFVTTGARAGGSAIARGDDMATMLGTSSPSDTKLAAAWNAYKPFRDWLSAKSVSPDSILTAAVFTVGNTNDPAKNLAKAVAAAPAPTATGWVKCAAGVASPCPQVDGDRACGADDPAFDELHALVTMNIFQKGTTPYQTPDQGGDLEYDGTGTPKLQGTQQVCMALTVPKGATGPMPLVIYAHGTGGSFRSHITEGVAARMAALDGGVKAAVLGIDQVEHGPRRGTSTASPNDLFFNFANPGAARGNPLQGAADQMMLVRFAQALSLPQATSPTGHLVSFNAIAYWGHSQGATEGAIAMPYITGVTGAVFSGEGASLLDALLSKKSPVDIADGVPFVLEDPGPDGVNTSHPVLSLLQNAIDVADPLNHARLIAAAPLAAVGAKNVFMPYGQKDTYAPPVTEATYAIAASLGVAVAAPSVTKPDAIASSNPVAVPASGNITDGTKKLTAFTREYAPDSTYDGHFVSTREATCKTDVDNFLSDALSGKVPQVGR